MQIGKTRVFLRAGQLAQLEGARGRRLTASALIIQAAFRCANLTLPWLCCPGSFPFKCDKPVHRGQADYMT